MKEGSGALSAAFGQSVKNARLPPLVALRAFDAIGRTQSIRAAGDELAVSHTVVSRHLRNLEAWLGVKLVEARGRGLVAHRGRRSLSCADRSCPRGDRASDRRPAPGIASYADHLVLSGSRQPAPAGAPARPRGASSRLGNHPASDPCPLRSFLAAKQTRRSCIWTNAESTDRVRAELLTRPRVFPVVSPTFMARYARVETTPDLLDLPLIHEDSTHHWAQWLTLAGLPAVPSLNGPRLWHAHLAIEAARLGQGVALANETLVEDDLKSGALIELLRSDIRLGGYYVIAPTPRWEEPTMIALRDWLRGLSPGGHRCLKCTSAAQSKHLL